MNDRDPFPPLRERGRRPTVLGDCDVYFEVLSVNRTHLRNVVVFATYECGTLSALTGVKLAR